MILIVASSVYSRAVRKAAELLGGRENLARILNIPVADVNKWIGGEKPPREIFLRVVDLIIDETAPPGDSAESDDAAPRDCAPAASPMQGRD
jgi:hypothetical protein